MCGPRPTDNRIVLRQCLVLVGLVCASQATAQTTNVAAQHPVSAPSPAAPPTGPSPDTTAASRLEAQPNGAMGTVTVTADSPAEVTLYVDGRALGALPRTVQLSQGMHEFTAIGPSVEAKPVRAQVTADQTMALGLHLVGRPGLFEIDPAAPDAVLLVDGQTIGPGRRTIALAPGRHDLELKRTGYKSQRLSLEVRPGQQQILRAGPYVVNPHAAREQPTSPPIADKHATPSNRILATPPQAVPVAAAEPSAKRDPTETPPSPYQGLFGSLIVPVMLGGKSTHSYVDACPAKSYGGACTTSAPRGGGLGLRLGYFYEWIGFEVMGAGAVDVSTTELKLPPIATISSEMQDAAGRNVFVRGGGMVGGGIRLAIPMQGLRFTVGANYLYIYRKIVAIPDSFAGASLAYSVPGWFIDGGIQLGGTPGARFYIGAFALIEQAHDLPLTRNLAALGVDPSLVPAELTQMTVYRGRQIFYGPLLGIAFGH